jgi:hypothetical protein
MKRFKGGSSYNILGIFGLCENKNEPTIFLITLAMSNLLLQILYCGWDELKNREPNYSNHCACYLFLRVLFVTNS